MARNPHGLSRFEQLVETNLRPESERAAPLPSTLGRLFPANEVQLRNLSDEQLIDILTEISLGMGDNKDAKGDAAAGMTFFGQFIDHDVTLDATSALGTRIVPSTIPNVRTPSLDLDCVYGAGPEATPHFYGSGADGTAFYLLYGNSVNAHDLARTDNGTALIGDPRNDENAIVSAIQANFVALHNVLMTEVLDDGGARKEIAECAHMGMSMTDWKAHVPSAHEAFEEVRRTMRLHYQWCVWHEFLPLFVDQACLDAAAEKDIFGPNAPIMPVEFTGAAYRFGHATTQPDYAMQVGGDQVDMMQILGFGVRETTAEMAAFFHMDGNEAQCARPVGPSLGLPLTALKFIQDRVHLGDIDHTITLAQSQNLPLRNMLRDRYTYKLTNGEAIVHLLKERFHQDVPKIEIHAHLKKHGITKTPLWLYCLMEAEQHGHGKLTGVGGLIVASVFARLLRLDPTTFWHAPGFKPLRKFANEGGILSGMLKYAETHRDSIANADKLKNGVRA